MNLSGEFDQKWKVTMSLLDEARALLCQHDGVGKFIAEYDEYFKQNEFELALDMLEEAALIAEEVSIHNAWVNLKAAAESMGLENRYAIYDHKISLS